MRKEYSIYLVAALAVSIGFAGGCLAPVSSPLPATTDGGSLAPPPVNPTGRSMLPSGGLSDEAQSIEKRLGYK